ncbi:CdaR family protein [Edaphobacillus lindanitolerans]|uniref:YbbR domain-containing protein n=1 Tax=Edaphobacillus lindanitolerans TaxID=550447 RepID=A0A1U7PRX8_9BACI|nr:CdaR family protein [Edaphobacillus lindanitolerans]SIT88137.1 YbbR domain-containing protein [Edaphobacillus lindanitolerans]
MDKFMDNPWFLRGVAFVLAVLLFLVVKTEEDQAGRAAAGTDIAVLQDVPVEVFYDDENLVVTGVPESVNLTIEGPANIVQTTRALKDFTLFVDLRSLVMGSHTVRIQHENLSDKLDVRIDPDTVDVMIEERITREFRVDPELNERLLAENYIINSIETDPATVMVTGAKSIVDSISFVKASISAEGGIDGPIEQQARVRVLDRELNKLNVDIEPAEVTVKADISEYTRNVPITLKRTGELPEGISVNEMTTATDTVKVSGPKSVLDKLEEIPVEVDLAKVTGTGKLSVEVPKPSGVTKVSPGKIEINVKTNKKESDEAQADAEETDEPETDAEQTENDKSEDIAAKPPAESEETPPPAEPEEGNSSAEVEESQELNGMMIEIRGLVEGKKGEIVQPPNGQLNLTLKGKRAALASAAKKDFAVFVDATGLPDGESSLNVQVNGPEGIDAVPSVNRVTVRILTA